MQARVLPRFVRWLFVALAASSLALSAQAQPEPITYGKVDARDLTAAPFVADSAAAAVVLADYGKLSFPTEGEFRLDRTTRIKILKKSGFSWATVEVLLRHELPDYAERLANLRGCTYNLVNGRVEQSPLVLPANTALVDKSEFYSLQRVALPQVREGSVIEVSYTVYSNYLVTLRSWEFQWPIPVRWSELRAALPHRLNYKMFVQAREPLAVEERTATNSLLPSFRWAMRDVPALRTEQYMTTRADYVDKVFFELAEIGGRNITNSWEQIDQLVLNDWERGQQLDRAGFLKNDLAHLPPATAGLLPRLAAVRELVCAAVRCNGQLGIRTSGSLRHIYEQTHQGTVADVNSLLITALRAAGFTANPLLLSTRAHGRVRATLPQISQFNYVAAHVRLPDGQELVLDATDPLLPYDMLPERCLNQQGRLVTGQAATAGWVALPPRYRRTHLEQVQLRLAPDGSLSGQVHEEFGGYGGAQLRTELLDLGDRKFAGKLAASLPGWTVGPLVIAQRDSVRRPLALDYPVQQPAAAAPAPDGTMHLSPLRDFGLERSPFPAESRQFPVDFGYGREQTLVLTLALPAGYALGELPPARTLELPDNGGRFVCSATPTEAGVQLTSRLLLRKPVYSVAEYGQLRALYQALLDNQSRQLLIHKKA